MSFRVNVILMADEYFVTLEIYFDPINPKT